MVQRRREFDARWCVCDALASDDALRPRMQRLLDVIPSMLAEGADRGTRPSIPNKCDYLNKLNPSNPLRPARQAAYDAVQLLCFWSLTCGVR